MHKISFLKDKIKEIKINNDFKYKIWTFFETTRNVNVESKIVKMEVNFECIFLDLHLTISKVDVVCNLNFGICT